MNRKLTKEDELEVYKQVLRGTRQSLVAKQFDISQGWVSTIYKNITKINDENLAVSTALQYIGEYTRQYDYVTMKQYELEALLQSTADEKLKEKIIMSQVSLSAFGELNSPEKIHAGPSGGHVRIAALHAFTA